MNACSATDADRDEWLAAGGLSEEARQPCPDASRPAGQQSGAARPARRTERQRGRRARRRPGCAGRREAAGTIIYFDYDRAEIKPEFVAVVTAHAKYLNANASNKVRLEGHSDERGSREYNIGLGERRAQAVRRALMLQGVTEAQITTVATAKSVRPCRAATKRRTPRTVASSWSTAANTECTAMTSAALRDRCRSLRPVLAGCVSTPPEEDPVVQKLTELDSRLLRIERVLANQQPARPVAADRSRAGRSAHAARPAR